MTTGLTDTVLAIHNAFRRDIELIDTAALEAARGGDDLDATIARFRFLGEVLGWHARDEDEVIRPLLESVAPSVYDTYEVDHQVLDDTFEALDRAVTAADPLATARATKAYKFHLDLHLRKEDTLMYRLIDERVSTAEQDEAMARMACAPEDRFAEVVAWMFPLMDHGDRVNMTRSWQMGMPAEGFAEAAALIESAVGDDWEALTRNIPELVGAD